MENFSYMLAAFTIIWAVLFGYILALSVRQKHLQRDIKQLQAMIREETKQ